MSIESVDKFLRSTEDDHLRSMTEINRRNDELKQIRKNIILNHWSFNSEDINRSNELYNEPYTVEEILSEAGLLYILGSFDACTLLSSIAVEKLFRFILSINNKVECKTLARGFNFSKDVVEVNTVKGIDYFAYNKGRLMHFKKYDPDKRSNCQLEEVPSLNEMLGKVKCLGYDVSDIEGRVEKSTNVSLFISTRDTTAHGNFVALGLNHEIYKLGNGEPVSPQDIVDLFQRHKKIALEQYNRACSFTLKAFQNFDSIYPYV